MDTPNPVVYTAHVTATGGREGRAVSDDGVIDLKLVPPKALGGSGAVGANPEQLFAAGYAACFIGAMKAVSGKMGLKLADDVRIDSSVGIGPIPTGFAIKVEMAVHVPGLDKTKVQEIVDAAHVVCPYSNATRNNVDVSFTIV